MHPDDDPGPLAPDLVEQGADELFREARALLGDRFAEARFDPDRGLRVTVIDLGDDDVTSLTQLAARLGIADWVRIEQADRAALAAWERLRHDLERLQTAEPGVLSAYPSPEPGYQRPPVSIDLAAHAEVTAAGLHDSYGDFVELRVGALPYPPGSHPPQAWSPRARGSDADTVNPAEMRIAWETLLVVRSGQTTSHTLLLTNLSDQVISVHTNGQLTAIIVDDTGAAVGGDAGWQTQPLVIFTVEPSGTVRIPVLVGTASDAPQLGYAVPAGVWHVTALLILGDGRSLRTPALDLTITA